MLPITLITYLLRLLRTSTSFRSKTRRFYCLILGEKPSPLGDHFRYTAGYEILSNHQPYPFRYYFVWIIKYRKPIRSGAVVHRVREVIRESCQANASRRLKGVASCRMGQRDIEYRGLLDGPRARTVPPEQRSLPFPETYPIQATHLGSRSGFS